ncbi:putative LRR containing protein [Trachipleistophora hominis]|uniref:Putative LRR containing protein n=1 Tax=Trachipleistophora hominis TaxID=72359 RepID=L7JX93_TRAHO|nr:putative LRR containing protein [Trachipleistophora hominis]
MVTASSHEEEYKIPLYIDFADHLFFPIPMHYCTINYKMLQVESFDFSFVYSSTIGLTIDVDFTGFLHKKNDIAQNRPPVKLYSLIHLENIYKMLCHPFISPDYVKTVVLRFSFIKYNIDLSMLRGKHIHLHCSNCIFGEETRLSQNLLVLHDQNSLIDVNLEMPHGLKTLKLANTQIGQNKVLIINEDCRKIKITGTTGTIRYPSVVNLDNMEFRYISWVLKFYIQSSRYFDKLYIKNVTFNSSTELGRDIKEIQLVNIIATNDAVISIYKSCQIIVLENCVGKFDLSKMVTWGRFEFKNNTSTFRLVNQKEKNIYEISMKNIYYDKTLESNNLGGEIKAIETLSDGPLNIMMNMNREHVVYKNKQWYVDIAFLLYKEMISKQHLTKNTYFYHFSSHGSNKLVIENAKLKGTWSLAKNGFREVILIDVQIEQDRFFEIDTECTSVFLQRCTGRFIIPGISSDKNEGINLSDVENSILIYKVKENIYNYELSNIQLKGNIVFTLVIHTARLTNVGSNASVDLKFMKKCEKLYLKRCQNIGIMSSCSLKKLRIDNFSDDWIRFCTAMSVHEFELSSCYNSMSNFFVMDSVKILQLYYIRLAENASFTIDQDCWKIAIKNVSGQFNIFYILKQSNNSATLTLKNGSFVFDKQSQNSRNHLLLKNIILHHTTEIQDNIHDLSLISITLVTNAVLKVNKECENLLIETCQCAIDFSRCIHLKSLYLYDNQFIYYEEIYKNINWLILINVKIDASIQLGEHISRVDLENINVLWPYCLNIMQNCEMVRISGSKGKINAISLDSFNDAKFMKEGTGIMHRRDVNKYGTSIYLRRVKIKRNYKLSSNIECVIANNPVMRKKAKLIVGSMCRYIKLINYLGIIDLSEVKVLKKAVFINNLPVIEDNRMQKNISSGINLLFISSDKKIIMPEYIESIELKNVTIKRSYTLIVGTDSKNVSLIQCKGRFDLSMIVHLKKLKLVVESKLVEILFPNLDSVENLEISYDDNQEYFEFLLHNCTNTKKLVLHNFVCELHNYLERYKLDILDANEYLWCLNEQSIETNNSAYLTICKQPGMLFSSWKYSCKPMFDQTRYKTLRWLSIRFFRFSEECVMMLKKFILLETLLIVLSHAPLDIFLHLPPNLKKFTITLVSCCITPYDCVTPMKINDRKINFSNRMLAWLRIHLLLLLAESKFTCFPKKLEYLEIIPYHSVKRNLEIPSFCKLKVRKLVILQIDEIMKIKIEKIRPLDEYYSNLVDLLTYFVDFEQLEELSIYSNNQETKLNPSNYV